jgi:hypothetical protein
VVDDIEFSSKPGFYSAAFSLTLATDTPGGTIRHGGRTAPRPLPERFTPDPSLSPGPRWSAVGIKPGWLDSRQEYLSVCADICSSRRRALRWRTGGGGYFNNQIMDYGWIPIL